MYEFTSQFFFDDALTDVLYMQAPYNSKGDRDTRNSTDGIFRGGGEQLLLEPAQTAAGYAVSLPIALDLSDLAIGASDAAGAMGDRGEPPAGGPLPGSPSGGPPPGGPGTPAGPAGTGSPVPAPVQVP